MISFPGFRVRMQAVPNVSAILTGTLDMGSHGGPWEPGVCSLCVGYIDLVPTLPRGNADSA